MPYRAHQLLFALALLPACAGVSSPPVSATPVATTHLPTPAVLLDPRPAATASAAPAAQPWSAPAPPAEWIEQRREDVRLSLPPQWFVTLPGTPLQPPERKLSATDAEPGSADAARVDLLRQTLSRAYSPEELVRAVVVDVERSATTVSPVAERWWDMPSLGSVAELRYRRSEPGRGPGAVTPVTVVTAFVVVHGDIAYHLLAVVPAERDQALRTVVEGIAGSLRVDR